jgi:hypothetical protein
MVPSSPVGKNSQQPSVLMVVVVSFYPMEMKVPSIFSNERLVIVIETSIIKKLLLMQNKLLFHSKLYDILNRLPS